MALEVNLFLSCTPRTILICEAAWTTPSKFWRQCAAVRKMLLPIWEEKVQQNKKRWFHRPLLLCIDCNLLWFRPQWAKDPSRGDQEPDRRFPDEKFYFKMKLPRPQFLRLSFHLIRPHIDNLGCTRRQRLATGWPQGHRSIGRASWECGDSKILISDRKLQLCQRLYHPQGVCLQGRTVCHLGLSCDGQTLEHS